MQMLHIKTNEQVKTGTPGFIADLFQQGVEIEIPDNQIYAYEKQKIDRALQDIEEGRTYSPDEVEKELIDAC